MNSFGLSIDELMQSLQKCRLEVGRQRGTIEIVIAGIHAYHPEKRNPGGILSKMMIRILEEKRDTIRCPKRGLEF